MCKKVLIVEDEKSIAVMEQNYLIKSGFECSIANTGSEAINLFYSNKFDLVILDLMIPEISGEQVLKVIRENSSVPIILVTAKVDEESVLSGLRNGADDYIRKPFSGNELVERVKAILRRSKASTSKYIVISDDGRLKIDFRNSRVIKDGKEVSLTKNELLILTTLYKNPQKTFTRNEIIEISFGYDYDAFDRAIDTHIKNIRHKIEDNPKNPVYIKTVYGLGYTAGYINEV